jgi:replication factor C large subunit
VVELNASDYRDRESIERRLLSAATSKSLFGKRNLILLDEIDEMAGSFDRGGGAAIASLIGKSKNPMIFIANDMWDQSISFLRGKTDAIEFKKLSPDTLRKILANVSDRFSMGISKVVIDMIANRSNGDARSAINDMSVLVGAENDTEVTEVIGLRDRKIDVFYLLDRIFTTNTLSAPLRAMAGTDIENDMLIKWLDENIPKRYTYSNDMNAAFNSLALASKFAARAQKKQYYTYWRYMNVMMSSGVALAKSHNPEARTAYSFPRVIKELSSSKGSRNQEREIAEKLSGTFHTGRSRIIREEMRMLSKIVNKAIGEKSITEEEARDELMKTYRLGEKEVDYLLWGNRNK